MNPETLQKFSSEFLSDEKELIVLIETPTNGAALYNDMWRPSNRPLAYIEVATGELYQGNIRLEWLVSGDTNWQYYFAAQKAFRIKVRPKKTELSHPNERCFMLIEVLEENITEPRFTPILEEYNTEVVYDDEDFYLKLNREFDCFEGKILYASGEVMLMAETTELTLLQGLLQSLKKITKDYNTWVNTLKTFAAEKLTELANDWQEEDTPEITSESFAQRMELTSINLSEDGELTVYFDDDDDDMFFGHAITVYTNLSGELKDADIEG